MNLKKLLFVISSLGGGGAERVLVNIINSLDKEKYKISLVVFRKKGPYLKIVAPHINIIDLQKPNKWGLYNLTFKLRRVINKVKPDGLISFSSYPNLVSILAMRFSDVKCKLIINERTYFHDTFFSRRLNPLTKAVISYLYNKAHCIIAVSKRLEQKLIRVLGMSPNRVKTIYNPVDINNINILQDESVKHRFFEIDKRKFVIVSAGRLTQDKRHDILLRAFYIARKELNVYLIILGEGELLDNLQKTALRMGVADHVDFIGFQNNPYKWMSRADLFVHSSEREGLPNAILEAMACGVPVVSTDCVSGPGEIITSGVDGVLTPVNNPEALADAITKVLRDGALKKRLVEGSIRRVEDFKIDKIVKQYEAIF